MAFDVTKRAEVFVTVEAESQRRMDTPATGDAVQHTQAVPFASEYAEEFARATIQPRAEISCLLSLLQPPVWMSGLWGDEKGGWRDARTDTLLSFDHARQLIDNRILELGLSPEKVRAYPHSHSSMAESQAFHRLPFDQRMNRFRGDSK
jgi:hypothetical protein